jgi:hypothetical protein
VTVALRRRPAPRPSADPAGADGAGAPANGGDPANGAGAPANGRLPANGGDPAAGLVFVAAKARVRALDTERLVVEEARLRRRQDRLSPVERTRWVATRAVLRDERRQRLPRVSYRRR